MLYLLQVKAESTAETVIKMVAFTAVLQTSLTPKTPHEMKNTFS